MDVEKLLAKASGNLSVRRAFGTGMTLSRPAHRKIRV